MVAKTAAMSVTVCDDREGRNGSNGNSNGGDGNNSRDVGNGRDGSDGSNSSDGVGSDGGGDHSSDSMAETAAGLDFCEVGKCQSVFFARAFSKVFSCV